MINEATLKWLNDPEVFRVNKKVAFATLPSGI